jgi:UDP-N-acetylmuramyl pentapeptide phosphotransferase/UDP-N-acetylglucosamine-1-phosphate transferase
MQMGMALAMPVIIVHQMTTLTKRIPMLTAMVTFVTLMMMTMVRLLSSVTQPQIIEERALEYLFSLLGGTKWKHNTFCMLLQVFWMALTTALLCQILPKLIPIWMAWATRATTAQVTQMQRKQTRIKMDTGMLATLLEPRMWTGELMHTINADAT